MKICLVLVKFWLLMLLLVHHNCQAETQYYRYRPLTMLDQQIFSKGGYFATDHDKAYLLFLNVNVNPGWLLLITPRNGVPPLKDDNQQIQEKLIYAITKVTSTPDTLSLEFVDLVDLSAFHNNIPLNRRDTLRLSTEVDYESEFDAPTLRATTSFITKGKAVSEQKVIVFKKMSQIKHEFSIQDVQVIKAGGQTICHLIYPDLGDLLAPCVKDLTGLEFP